MKKSLIIVTGILILFSCTFYFITKSRSDTVQINITATKEDTFVITSRGEDYLEFGGKGAQVGDRISTLLLQDVSGKEIYALGKRKTLLVFSSSYLEMYYPLIQEWAKTYGRLIDVILVCKEEPEVELKQQLLASGVNVIFSYETIAAKVDPGNMNFSYLINEVGEIVYRFRFLAHQWRELSRDVDLFARKDIVPSGLRTPELALGKPFELASNCSWLGLREGEPKPTILFLLNSGDPVSKALHPVAQSLYKRYHDEVNINLVYSTYSALNENNTKEYFERYGKQMEFVKWKESWGFDAKPDSTVLDSIPVYFDQGRYIFDHPGIWMTPTVLILDWEALLVDIIGIGHGGGMTLPDLETVLQKQLVKLFE